MVHIIYNPKANNGRGREGAEKIKDFFPNDEINFVNTLELSDIYDYIEKSKEEDILIVSGGDGTINRFINDLDGRTLSKDVYYYPSGSGNDFWNDIEGKKEDIPVRLNKYLENLPKVSFDGITRYFINGIGYGIDGYCCEKGDEHKQKSTKPVNYTAIALKGLLYDFKPRNATIIVDGVEHKFSHCWLAPIMNGRYYGGGMNVAPDQDRLNEERTLSVIALHSPSSIWALIIFPKIFKGKLVECKKNCSVFVGKKIKVIFDEPCALQIDGETHLNVLECVGEAYEG